MHKNNSWKQSFLVCRESMRKWTSEPRVWAVLILLFLFEWTQIQTLREYCIMQGLAVSNWYFPFLFSGGFVLLYFYMGVLLVFCDAPFVDGQQLYVILRTGSRNWFRGKIIYIFLTSCIYYLLMYAISLLESIPYLGFSSNWEMVLQSLAADGNVGIYRLKIPERVLSSFSPVTAFFLCYIINVLITTFIGLLIFYINLYKSNNLGVGIAFVVILLSACVQYMPTNSGWILQYFSPVSWADLDIFTKDYGGVPLSYAFIFLIVGIGLLSVLIMRRQKVYNIESMEEV